jgi:hypothetical protein
MRREVQRPNGTCRPSSASPKHTLLLMSLAVLAVFSAVTAPSAQASATTFDLTLTPYNGSLYGGTGTLTLNQSPSFTNPSEFYTIGGTDSLALTVTIDSVTFTATGSGCTAEYTDGTLDSLYNCSFSSTNSQDSLSNIGLYGSSGGYQGTIAGASDGGSITISAASDPPPVAPEPSTWVLWGTGLLGIAIVMRKRLLA